MSIIERIYHVPMGLALFPDEVELFDYADVRPFLGIGKGTGIIPVWFQMIKAPCPYYNHERYECTIYRRRPVVCRAYPFKVVLNYTRPGRCTWLNNQTPKRNMVLPPEITRANRTIAAYDRTVFNLVKLEQIRLYNVETNEWIAIQNIAHTETVAEFNPPVMGIMRSEWNVNGSARNTDKKHTV